MFFGNTKQDRNSVENKQNFTCRFTDDKNYKAEKAQTVKHLLCKTLLCSPISFFSLSQHKLPIPGSAPGPCMHANKLSTELRNQPTTNPDTVQLTVSVY